MALHNWLLLSSLFAPHVSEIISVKLDQGLHREHVRLMSEDRFDNHLNYEVSSETYVYSFER